MGWLQSLLSPLKKLWFRLHTTPQKSKPSSPSILSYIYLLCIYIFFIEIIVLFFRERNLHFVRGCQILSLWGRARSLVDTRRRASSTSDAPMEALNRRLGDDRGREAFFKDGVKIPIMYIHSIFIYIYIYIRTSVIDKYIDYRYILLIMHVWCFIPSLPIYIYIYTPSFWVIKIVGIFSFINKIMDEEDEEICMCFWFRVSIPSLGFMYIYTLLLCLFQQLGVSFLGSTLIYDTLSRNLLTTTAHFQFINNR